jgi:hypothetical protein
VRSLKNASNGGFVARNELVAMDFARDLVLVKPGLLLNGLLIDLESSRHQLLELINPSVVGWMSRHQFRRLPTLTCRHHPFPESHRLARIVSGAGHVGKPDLIRLQFVLAAEWQQDAVLRAGSKHSQQSPLRLGVHVGHRSLDSHHRDLDGILLKNSLGAVPRGRMRDFMSENSGQTRLIPCNRQKACVDHNLASGEAKCVLGRIFNHCDLPLIPLGAGIDNPDQSGSYPPDKVIIGTRSDNTGMTDNLAKALKSQLLLLCVSQAHVGFAAGFRINKCLRRQINPTNGDSRKKDREEAQGTPHRSELVSIAKRPEDCNTQPIRRLGDPDG